ncbi:MAG: HD domain-containing protein [Clostridia bacterium]|nr:HD domain-containing protein [Clostridia bacterium]
MEIDLEKQKEHFLEICHSQIHRDGLDALLDWLCKADFFQAPASTRYHGAYAGGLCQHSLDVYEYAQKLAFLSPVPVKDESLCIASLFHDVCKVNMYKTDKRNQKLNGEWVEVPFYSIDERFHFGGHGAKSVYQVQWFMKLTQEEAVAIHCHMGFSDGNAATVRDVSNAYGQFPLAWIIHVADEAATYLLER